jgi:NAD(P)H-nitrite reductase large subunit
LGCRLEFNARAGGWVTWHDADQQTSVDGVYIAGEVGGIGGADVALAEGTIAALAAARALGKTLTNDAKKERETRRQLKHAREFADVAGAMMQLKPGLLNLITDDTIICRCENVTAAQISDAIKKEKDVTIRGVKVQTRAGMGPCQGRMCGCTLARLIASQTSMPLDSIHLDSARVPIKPVPLRVLANSADR